MAMASLLPSEHHPILHRPRARTVVLLTLLMATLIMPVNYRAGTETGHSHTIFQGIIDTIVGHPHHHENQEIASTPEPRSSVSPFASVAIPLSVLVHTDDAVSAGTPTSPEPDLPSLLGLSVPISSTAAIQGLSILIAALLAGFVLRPLWSRQNTPNPWCFGQEPPPPRMA